MRGACASPSTSGSPTWCAEPASGISPRSNDAPGGRFPGSSWISTSEHGRPGAGGPTDAAECRSALAAECAAGGDVAARRGRAAGRLPGSVSGVAAGGGVEGVGQRDVGGAVGGFQDPVQEWRRLFLELVGPFFLVVVACGRGVMGEAFPNTISRSAAVTAPGLMVLGIILFMGKVSGAHLNPAVSVAFSLRGDFPWRRVPGYIVAQLIGASLAAWFAQSVINASAVFGSNYPASGYTSTDAFLMEAVLTLGL